MSLPRSYWLLMRWQTLRYKWILPLTMVVQGLFAFGIVAGYPLLFPEIDKGTIMFLATGAPAISLIMMGLVAVPQIVSQGKTEGSLEYIRCLPIPRISFLLADLSVWTLIVLPGVILAVAVGALRFGLELSLSPLVVPAFLLVALTASCVGYALATLLPPMVSSIVSQILIVVVLMFSPLSFPVERLPNWLQIVHSVLPIQAMGEVIRASLASTTFPLKVESFVMLGAWGAGSLLVALLALNRRI